MYVKIERRLPEFPLKQTTALKRNRCIDLRLIDVDVFFQPTTRRRRVHYGSEAGERVEPSASSRTGRSAYRIPERRVDTQRHRRGRHSGE